MVYGAPSQNLSLISGAEYDSQDGAVSTWTVAEIFVGPLIFVSPSHVRLRVQLNSRSGNVTTIQNNSYSSTLAARCKNQLAFPITNNIGSQSPGTADYSITQVLDADFTNATGDNRVDYIDMGCLVIIDGLSLDPSIAKTFDMNTGNYRFYIEWIESAYVVVGKNNTPGRISRYAQHCCLPPNPVQGQTHRIKNGSYGATAINVFIHTIGNQIDNKNSTLFFSTSYTSTYPGFSQTYPFAENGFVLPPLNACMFVYDGSKWLIQEYFNGARDANSYEWAGETLPLACPIANKPVVLCDINASKYVQLPDPSGPLKLIRIIALSTTQNMSNVVRIYPFTGAKLEDNRDKSFYLRAYNAVGTACMALISDGTQWWVFNVYDGLNSTYTTQTGRNVVTSPISIVRTLSADGVELPPITLPAGLAIENFVKMDAASLYNSVVINTTDSTAVRIGTAANNCMYVGPWKNYTAVSVIGLKNGINTVYYVTGFFSGF